MLRSAKSQIAHNAGDAISKTSFSICVSPEAEAEIKTCHQGQLNLHELTIKAKNAFEGIYFYVLFRRMPVHSRVFFIKLPKPFRGFFCNS